MRRPSKKISIVLTGGHAATPGIATVEEIRGRDQGSSIEISWIGAKEALSGTGQATTEYKIFPKIGVRFYSINAGKLQTKFTRYTIPLLLKIPLGFFQAIILLLKIKPKLVLSFGGFASLPVVFWAYILRIPVILHEQTVAFGRANMVSSFFATEIALARTESSKFFPENKSVVTGNPVTNRILMIQPKDTPSDPKIILVMGGSRGSQFINDLVMDSCKKLLEHYRLMHITGENEFDRVDKFRSRLSEELRSRYEVFSFISPREMAEKYKLSDIIVGRAGANSISEILIIKRPAILIPLPRTFMDEQVKNALFARDFGIARILEEKDATVQNFMKLIDDISSNWQEIAAKVVHKESPDRFAAKKLVDLIFKNLP